MGNNGKINRCFVAFNSVQRRPPKTTIEQIHICAYCDTQICTHRRIRYLDLFVVPLPLDSAEPIYLLYAVEHVAIHSLCDVGRMPSIFFVFRDGQWADVFWDSTGIAMMGLVLWYVKRTGKGKWILGANGSQQSLCGLFRQREIT